MRLLYVLASYLLFAVLFPVLSLHRKTRHGLKQRLGFYAPGELPPRGPGPTFWLHGASAGDLLALSPMFAPLRARFPGCRIVLSTMTNSGYMMGRERLAKQVDAVVYSPYDLWGATRRAVRAIQPDLLVLEYTEIWPNLIRAAKRAGGDEAERVLGLGAPRERVFVTGNTKFDALAAVDPGREDEALRVALGLKEGERVWIAGSTHEGEEEHLLAVYRRLLEAHPELRLVIAPRYIDRAGRIAALAREAGLSVGLRSKGNEERGKVVVLDSMGELSRAYRLASLVFVGGSFTTRGGQNILEPAGQGKPVLFGPHMENFQDSVQVLVGRGGIQVNDAEHLYRVVSELLAKPETVASLGELARTTVRQVSGASQRNVEHMARVLGP